MRGEGGHIARLAGAKSYFISRKWNFPLHFSEFCGALKIPVFFGEFLYMKIRLMIKWTANNCNNCSYYKIWFPFLRLVCHVLGWLVGAGTGAGQPHRGKYYKNHQISACLQILSRAASQRTSWTLRRRLSLPTAPWSRMWWPGWGTRPTPWSPCSRPLPTPWAFSSSHGTITPTPWWDHLNFVAWKRALDDGMPSIFHSSVPRIE